MSKTQQLQNVVKINDQGAGVVADETVVKTDVEQTKKPIPSLADYVKLIKDRKLKSGVCYDQPVDQDVKLPNSVNAK